MTDRLGANRSRSDGAHGQDRSCVVDHLEWRLLDPARLTTMMDQLLERRGEWNERASRAAGVSQFYTELVPQRG